MIAVHVLSALPVRVAASGGMIGANGAGTIGLLDVIPETVTATAETTGPASFGEMIVPRVGMIGETDRSGLRGHHRTCAQPGRVYPNQRSPRVLTSACCPAMCGHDCAG